VRRLSCSVLLMLLAGLPAGVAFAQQTDGREVLSAIRKKLISEDFREREAGTSELMRLSVTHVDLLRAAEKAETDAEVKARLKTRVDQMEVEILVRRPNLSLDVKDKSIADISRELNRQLGAEILIPAGNWPPVTLAEKDIAFWELMSKLHEKTPFKLANVATNDAIGWVTQMRLSPAEQGTTLTIKDAFAYQYSKTATANSTGWSIPVTVCIDPRLRIADFETGIRVSKLVSSTGENLLRLVTDAQPTISNFPTPTAGGTVTASIGGVQNLTRIAELQGTLRLKIVEHRRIISFDLTKEKQEAVDTGEANFAIVREATGRIVLQTRGPSGSDVPISSLPSVAILVRDKQGIVVRTVRARGSTIALSTPARGVAPPAEVGSVEVSYVEKAREYVLPLVLKDIELPALPPPAPEADALRQAQFEFEMLQLELQVQRARQVLNEFK
jgi:hypothetical protein